MSESESSVGRPTTEQVIERVLGVTKEEAIARVMAYGTDVGIARRFARVVKDVLRYDSIGKRWLAYGLGFWHSDLGDSAAMNRVMDFASIEMGRADKVSPEPWRKMRLAWAMKQCSEASVRRCVSLARGLLAKMPDDFDSDGTMLNCPNFTVDLTTGKWKDHDWADFLTKKTGARITREAKSELWERFLDDATGGDKELQAFLQRAVGYSAFGSSEEEKLFFVWGPGASGKSTFLEAISRALGDYADTIDFNMFTRNGGPNAQGPSPEFAKLKGKRLVLSSEIEDGARIAEGLLKRFTGGDSVSARHLFGRPFSYTPQFTLWLVANSPPWVNAGDEGIWRRMVRIPFNHSIPKEKRDPEVKKQLKYGAKHQEAILKWIVEGAEMWRRVGLRVPDVVTRSTEEYRQSQDLVADFLLDRCEPKLEAYVRVAELREAYEKWCKDTGRRPIGARRFIEEMRRNGHEAKNIRIKLSNGGSIVARCWDGIGLR